MKNLIGIFSLSAIFLLNCFTVHARIKVGVSFATLQEERWSREKEILNDVAKERDIKLVFQSANGDENTQNQQIENLITQKVDVLIIVPQNRQSVVPAVKMAKAENIPVIAYDRLIPSKDVALYVSFDSVKVGEAQARAILKQKESGNYLWLGGHPADDNAHLVRQGHMNILGPYIKAGKIKLVGEQWCQGWSPLEALKHTENALTANQNKIDAILASNDGTAGGAIQALTAQNLQGIVPVSGQDAELSAVQRVAEGTQTVTILKDIRLLAKEAIDSAIKLASKDQNGAKISSQQIDGINAKLLDVIAVTKENLDQVIIKGGFHQERQVYRNILRKKK